MANDPISDIVAEMSGKVTERQLREAKKAQKTAQQERVAEQVEVARQAAIATLNEKDRREADWCFRNLGSLSDHELRKLIRQEHGFEPI